jgi:hypothetical protein
MREFMELAHNININKKQACHRQVDEFFCKVPFSSGLIARHQNDE